jgi:hypothetical protein
MNITTEKAAEAKPIIGVDIAKNCFQLAVAEAGYRIQGRHRLTRTRFAQFMSNRPGEPGGDGGLWERPLLGASSSGPRARGEVAAGAARTRVRETE